MSFFRQWETFIGHPFSAGNKTEPHKDGFFSELQTILEVDCDILRDMYWPRGNLMCLRLWEGGFLKEVNSLGVEGGSSRGRGKVEKDR